MLTECTQTIFQQSFPAEIAALPRIMADVIAAARQVWSGNDLGRLELVLEEGVVNIITHAYPENSGEVRITLSTVKGGMLLRLEDDGIPFDPAASPLPALDAPAEDRPIGGLGIHLIKSIAERIECRREQGKNVLEILLVKSDKDDRNSQ